MSSKSGYSKKILALLGAKPAISVAELADAVEATGVQKYALTRSLKGLAEAGLVENHHSGQNGYIRLTKEGKKKVHSLKLDSDTDLINPHWDGKWRIILLDLPEQRKSERDALRYLLKKAGFVCLKNATWISPLPYEFLFRNIKKDLGLTSEMIVLTTDDLDTDTEAEFLKLVT